MKTKLHIRKTMLASIFAIITFIALSFQAKAQPCQAGFTFTVNTNTVTFTNTSTGAGQPMYYWGFGDGNYDWQTNEVHTYTSNGTYVVCVTMYDSSNWAGCQSTFCDTVVIVNAPNPPCNAYFVFYPDSNNTAGGIQFYDQSSNSPVSWSWSFPGGTPSTSTQQNPVVTYPVGVHTACLTIVDTFGNTCTYCDTVAYYPCNIVAGFTFNSSNDPQISFTNTSTGGYSPSYTWNFGDGNSIFSTNASHTYQYSGSYVVCLTAYDSVNNCYDSFCDTLVITNAPVLPCTAQFYAWPDSNNTLPGTIYFWDYSTGGPTSWFWDFGDGSNSTAQHPTHQYAQPGNYWVCLTVITPNSTCTTCDSVQYKIFGAGVGEHANIVSNVQNYPNPFFKTTTISYTLEKNSAVEISVYDHIGKKVAELENGNKTVGQHQLEWNAENLSEGIYFLEVKANNSRTTSKLVLIK